LIRPQPHRGNISQPKEFSHSTLNKEDRMKPTTISLSLLAFVFAFSTNVLAVNFTVNQPGDAGDLTCDATCTLRDAIDDANNLASNDTIDFGFRRVPLNLPRQRKDLRSKVTRVVKRELQPFYKNTRLDEGVVGLEKAA
jgi:hypothetical protein